MNLLEVNELQQEIKKNRNLKKLQLIEIKNKIYKNKYLFVLEKNRMERLLNEIEKDDKLISVLFDIIDYKKDLELEDIAILRMNLAIKELILPPELISVVNEANNRYSHKEQYDTEEYKKYFSKKNKEKYAKVLTLKINNNKNKK